MRKRRRSSSSRNSSSAPLKTPITTTIITAVYSVTFNEYTAGVEVVYTSPDDALETTILRNPSKLRIYR